MSEDLPPTVAEIVATQDFSFFTPEEWQRFTGAVAASLQRVGPADAEYGGQGYIKADSVGFIMLDNVSRLCHANPPDEWDRILDQFLGSVATRRPEEGTLDELRVRLVPDQMDHTTIGKEWAPTIIQELCFDFPTTVVGASAADLDRLQIGEDEAFAVGWRQTLATTVPQAGQLFTTDGEPKQTLFSYQFGESYFVSCLVQDLPRFAGALGPDGALFAVPSRTGFCIHRIGVDAPLDLALSALLQFIPRAFDDAVRQVSRELFWWRDGKVIWLPTTTDAGGLPILNANTDAVRHFNEQLGR